MIFLIRARTRESTLANVRVVHSRATPATADTRDLFCVANEHDLDRLRGDGMQVVALHDGWYADDHGGGVAVWGNGRYWEVRETPFDVIDRG